MTESNNKKKENHKWIWILKVTLNIELFSNHQNVIITNAKSLKAKEMQNLKSEMKC